MTKQLIMHQYTFLAYIGASYIIGVLSAILFFIHVIKPSF